MICKNVSVCVCKSTRLYTNREGRKINTSFSNFHPPEDNNRPSPLSAFISVSQKDNRESDEEFYREVIVICIAPTTGIAFHFVLSFYFRFVEASQTLNLPCDYPHSGVSELMGGMFLVSRSTFAFGLSLV